MNGGQIYSRETGKVVAITDVVTGGGNAGQVAKTFIITLVSHQAVKEVDRRRLI